MPYTSAARRMTAAVIWSLLSLLMFSPGLPWARLRTGRVGGAGVVAADDRTPLGGVQTHDGPAGIGAVRHEGRTLPAVLHLDGRGVVRPGTAGVGVHQAAARRFTFAAKSRTAYSWSSLMQSSSASISLRMVRVLAVAASACRRFSSSIWRRRSASASRSALALRSEEHTSELQSPKDL